VEAQNLNEFLDRCVVGGVGGIGSKRRSGSAPGSECLESPDQGSPLGSVGSFYHD
jgi:hypothetical protein